MIHDKCLAVAQSSTCHSLNTKRYRRAEAYLIAIKSIGSCTEQHQAYCETCFRCSPKSCRSFSSNLHVGLKTMLPNIQPCLCYLHGAAVECSASNKLTATHNCVRVTDLKMQGRRNPALMQDIECCALTLSQVNEKRLRKALIGASVAKRTKRRVVSAVFCEFGITSQAIVQPSSSSWSPAS